MIENVENHVETVDKKPEGFENIEQKIKESKNEIAAAQSKPVLPKKKMGRPLGSFKKPRPKINVENSVENVENSPAVIEPKGPPAFAPDVAKVYKTCFQVWAAKVGVKEVELSDADAKDLGEATAGAIELWLPEVGKLDPKKQALIGLTFAIGSVFISRIIIIHEAQKKAAENPPPQAQNVQSN